MNHILTLIYKLTDGFLYNIINKSIKFLRDYYSCLDYSKIFVSVGWGLISGIANDVHVIE
jgi:hypothetical protein